MVSFKSVSVHANQLMKDPSSTCDTAMSPSMGNSMSQSPPAPPAVRKGLTAKEARRINSLETIHPNNVSPHIQDSESIVRDNGAQTINSGNSDTLSQLAPEEKLDETTTTPRKRKIFKPVSRAYSAFLVFVTKLKCDQSNRR